MALSLRSNGSGANNLISASWFNDFYNLLTGAMTDQPVKIVSSVTSQAVGAAPGAPTLAVQAGGSVDVGAHTYAVTFVAVDGGETVAGTTAVATTTSGNQTVALSIIPTGSTGTTQRKVYRSKAGTTSPLFLVTTLNNNTTTTYSDLATDASLSATTSPLSPSFGGSLLIKDSGGSVKAQVFSDGSAAFGGTVSLAPTPADSSPAANARILNFATGNSVVYKTAQTGAAQGHSFGVWNGSALTVPFSIGGQFTSALSWIDANGNLIANGYFGSAAAHLYLQTHQGGGSALGLVLGTWNGSSGVVPFSVGGQLAGALSWVDTSGNFNTNSNGSAVSAPNGVVSANALQVVGGGWSNDIQLDTVNHIVNFWTPSNNATPWGQTFYGWNGSAQVPAIQIQTSGVCYIGTNRNGSSVCVPIFTGTTTPVNPPTGSIWIKA